MTERLGIGEALAERVYKYLPPREVLNINPSSLDVRKREEYREHRPGCEYAAVIFENRIVFVPAWHPLHTVSIASNSTVYGTGCMETLTCEPFINPNGELIGGNLVLLEARMERLFERALPSREIDLPFLPSTLSSAINDYLSVMSGEVLVDKSGTAGRASVRIFVGHGVEQYGKSAVGQRVVLSVESYRSENSISEEVVVGAGPDQRFEGFCGKQSSKYGEAGKIGKTAEKVGASDAILFAPFFADGRDNFVSLTRYKSNLPELREKMLKMALSNGLGAEILGIKKDGTLLILPMEVNRLGGVTAYYITKYMAPRFGIRVEERLFSLGQVVSGEIESLIFVGNAARVKKIVKVILHNGDGTQIGEIKLGIHPLANFLRCQFEKEVAGIDSPSHESLLTPIDYHEGFLARQVLDQEFIRWR